MDLLLKPELQNFVADKIKAGQYANVNDIVNEALEVLRDQEDFTPEHEAYLRRELRRGIEQLDRGEYSTHGAQEIIAQERQRKGGKKGRA